MKAADDAIRQENERLREELRDTADQLRVLARNGYMVWAEVRQAMRDRADRIGTVLDRG